MNTKHSFGTPVQCAICKTFVDAVWAETYEQAVAGHGHCDECQARQEMQKTATADVPPDDGTKMKEAEGGD